MTWADLAKQWDSTEDLTEILKSSIDYAHNDPDSFWDWFLTLDQKGRENGGFFINVLWSWNRSRNRPEEVGVEELRRWDKTGGFKPPVPQRAFHPMIKAAIEERCPSFNRNFIEPLVWAFGRQTVVEALLKILFDGTPEEVTRAKNAIYWANAFPAAPE